VASLPLRSLSLLVFGTALYYITGLRTDGFQYVVVFISDLLLLICASVALGMLVQVSVHRLEYGQIVMPFLVVVSFIFGNLSTAPDPTWILRWIQFISPVFYSFQCLIQNELAGASAADDTDLAAYLDLNEFDEIPIAACLPALAGFAILYLVLTTIIYHYRYPKMKLL
jgi:ABC-type multidrug transport system permease subunit